MVFLKKKHISNRVLMSEDGKWLSNGYWLFKTSTLDERQAAIFSSVEEAKSWLTTTFSIDECRVLSKENIQDLTSVGHKMPKVVNRTSLVDTSIDVPAQVFVDNEGCAYFMKKEHDELFAKRQTWVYLDKFGPFLDNATDPSFVVMPVLCRHFMVKWSA